MKVKEWLVKVKIKDIKMNMIKEWSIKVKVCRYEWNCVVFGNKLRYKKRKNVEIKIGFSLKVEECMN